MVQEGDVIKGRFRVVRRLGQGGMGSVFEVYDQSLHRRLALKELRSDLHDSEFAERFLREGRALAALSHPNILPIFDLFEDSGNLSLLMPLIEGHSARTLLKEGPLPLHEAGRIVRAVAQALDYAHERGIIHRDVKPENVLIENSGNVLLTDFGIAKLQQDNAEETKEITVTGTIIGTPNYMAPESLVGAAIDHRADIYALGIVAFEMLAGTRPFDRETPIATVLAHINEAPPRITELHPEVPRRTEQALLVALAKRPEDRFATASLFAEAAFPTGQASPVGAGAGGLFYRIRLAIRKVTTLLTGKELGAEITPAPIEAAKQSPPAVPPQPAPPPAPAQAGPAGETVVAPASLTELLAQEPAPPGPPESSEAGEFTRIFQVAPSAARPAEVLPEEKKGERPRVSLTFIASSDTGTAGRSIPITSTPFVIGRSPQANLSIVAELAISREHCVIEWQNNAYTLRDLGSRNGTWLNGRVLRSGGPEVLSFGSVIRFSASTALTFVAMDVSELPELTGCVLEGRFKLVEELRRSSKTAVYKADDLRLPRHVAVKILSPALASYPGYLEQFNQEAEMAARMRHPHIAKVVDFGRTTITVLQGKALEVHYVCMEYMDGGSLARMIGGGQHQTAPQVARWLEPVADALDYAHRNEIVHSGLKPTSIVFDEEGKPYVTDFALASHIGHSTKRMFLGTPDFMAPEEWEGVAPTPAADQYALAVLTYFALAGVRPYEGQLDPDTRKRNFDRGAPPVHEEGKRQGNTEVPEAISDVIARGMAIKTDDRYPSVREFALAFQQALTAPAKQKSGPPEVFLSYRRDAGAGWAALFARELRRRDISVFVDTERRDNVVRFPAWLQKAIQDCDVFICLLTSNTLESAWVREEIRVAWENGKPMVPILQEDFKMPDASTQLDPHIEALLTYQGVPLLDRKGVYIDATIADLAKMIQASTGRPNAKSAG